jgi:hypothetical protein
MRLQVDKWQGMVRGAKSLGRGTKAKITGPWSWRVSAVHVGGKNGVKV